MQKPLTYVKPGQVFTYGGIPWIKLEDKDGATLALSEKSVFDRAFSVSEERSIEQYNNWALSSLRRELNEKFLETLIENGADGGTFLDMTVDLTTDDGLTDYGTTTDKITLISCDQYRKYRKLIPALDNWCWTVTAYSCNATNSYAVRLVNAGGTLCSNYAHDGSRGVRPLCNLLSEILVSVGDDTEADEKTQDTALADLGHEIGVIVADCLRKVADIFDDRNHTGG